MTSILIFVAVLSLIASYAAMVHARQYIAVFRDQETITLWGNMSHAKSWLAIILSSLLAVFTTYRALSASFASEYEFPSQLLLGAAIALFVTFGLCLTVIDLRTMKLPTKIIYWGLLTLIVLLSITSILEQDYMHIATMMISGLASSFVMALLWYFIAGGFGFGDVRLMLLTGAVAGWFGYEYAIWGFIFAFVLMSVVYAPLMLLKIVGRKTKAPFGPWIIFGTIVSIVFSDILSNSLIPGGLL